MGIGNISWFQILVILVIVLLIFGTKRIRNIGSDLGGAIREFRKSVGENEDEVDEQKNSGASAASRHDEATDHSEGSRAKKES